MKVGGTISVILSYPSSGCLRIFKLEVYMNIRQCTALDHHEPYCICRSWLHYQHQLFTPGWSSILSTTVVGNYHATSLRRGLQLAYIGSNIDCRTWWKTCGICFLQYGLFIPTVEGCALESTGLNQWPWGWERILLDKLEPTEPRDGATKGVGTREN